MEEPTANWDHCLQHAALSDVGLRRANNQDSVAVVIADSQETWQQRGHLFMVADGMGAHAAGELASKMATDTVTLAYGKLDHLPPPEAILLAVEDANATIHGRGEADEEFRGMGTTSTTMLLLPQGALLAHVGDSRAYRLRGNRFEQLTFDHSLVWELRAAGQLPDDELLNHIPKNIITRSLGPNESVQVDLEGPFPIAEGDTFLLCSDGLSGPVEDEEIGAVLAAMPPDEAVRALVDLANLRGGPDNITVVVARVTGPQLARGGASTEETPAARKTARPVPPVVWTLLGVAALATAMAAVMAQWWVALGCLAGTGLTAAAALVIRYGGQSESGFDGKLLGKGPHTVCKVAADSEFVDRLEQIVRELRDAATHDDWSIDWSRFNALQSQAAAAKKDAQHARAVREHFHAIRFMVDQLKHQRRSSDEDESGGSDSASVLDP